MSQSCSLSFDKERRTQGRSNQDIAQQARMDACTFICGTRQALTSPGERERKGGERVPGEHPPCDSMWQHVAAHCSSTYVLVVALRWLVVPSRNLAEPYCSSSSTQ